MKNNILFAIVILIIGVICWAEPRYQRKDCVVVEVEQDLVVVQDQCGYEWEYYTDDTIKVGERVDLKMHTNFTDTITDDIVIGVK